MKRILLIVCIAASCSTNPKVAIVERQKQIKIELAEASLEKMHFIDSVSKLDLSIEEEAANNRKAIEKEWQLQKEYDSLEMELKKY